MDKALSVLQSASSKNESAIVVDADEAFGQSIGLQLKNITNDQSKAYAKMKIYEVLFQAQFGVSGATQPQHSQLSQQQRQLSTSPIYNPGHKYFRLVHILNEFYFHHKRSKGISNDIKSS